MRFRWPAAQPLPSPSATTVRIIGCAGYGATQERPATVEVGLWIGAAWWGRGYGTEAAQALIDHAFADGRADALWCSNRVTNDRARRVIEKCGFQFRGTGMVRSPTFFGAFPVERFVLDRRNWASLKAWGAPGWSAEEAASVKPRREPVNATARLPAAPAVRPSDADALAGGIGDPAVCRMLARVPLPIAERRRGLHRACPPAGARWPGASTSPSCASGRLIGGIGINDLPSYYELGYWLGVR